MPNTALELMNKVLLGMQTEVESIEVTRKKQIEAFDDIPVPSRGLGA